MSDKVEDTARHYQKDVREGEHSRSIGLFTIPEYPEFEAGRGMWSAALDAILTTLRYIAPATLLSIFWGQQSFLFKILKHIDSAFRAIVFSSEEQKQSVLQWLTEAGPVKVEHLDGVWGHGWILCGVLDAALPGACAGHPPTRLSLKHAQAIADHYLGVEPVFSRQELESKDALSRHQEWKLATYLDRIRQALSKLKPPVSKPVSQRTSPETKQCTLDYVAKGSGLIAAQVNNRAYFRIYPTTQQGLDPGEITVLIRGPKDTYGMAVLPPILGKGQILRQKLLGLQSKQSFTENILPLTQGATYLRSYGKNDMSKTYYIPKTKYDVDINVEIRTDHAKICYTVNLEGRYEVSITSRGENIVGSPFSMTASNDIVDILEKDSSCLEDGEEIDIVDIKTDRKVVLRIVDFVTEKMLLRENGTLEKISEDDAKILMDSEVSENESLYVVNKPEQHSITIDGKEINKHTNKFITVVHKVLVLNKVCKVFNDLKAKKQMISVKKDYVVTRDQPDIPDIVNSALNDINPCVFPERLDKYIVPENIMVSLKTEKSKLSGDQDANNAFLEINNMSTSTEFSDLDNPNISHDESYKEQIYDSISADRMTPLSTNNPFLNDMYEDSFVATNFRTFVPSEFERNNSQNEETRESSITIMIDTNITPSPTNNNPFICPDSLDIERPKTPILKILSDDKLNNYESEYIHPKFEFSCDEIPANEFINPFFMHHHQSNQNANTPVTDFIIGAPVSLPPIIRAPSPEPVMKSFIITENKNMHKARGGTLEHEKTDEICESILSTPLHAKLSVPKNKVDNSSESSTFHSLESNLTENNSRESTTSESQFERYQTELDQNHRKDIWDSAYVSIDDNSSSPDSNNNESTIVCETLSKQKFYPNNDIRISGHEGFSHMGPAEKELWQTCSELNYDAAKIQEDIKPCKWELKRPTFTPIIEESDRSISLGTKNLARSDEGITHETETISEAFAELNDMYQEYFPNSETNSTIVAREDKLDNLDVKVSTKIEDVCVDSASENSDVKRRENYIEGKTSEVQANVTESVSVSQTLRNEKDHFGFCAVNKEETQFGDNSYSNIVMEKKKYWDEKIKQIEEKEAATPVLQKRKKISSKYLKHNDSLSKRKGKQMIKKFLHSGDYSQVKKNSDAIEVSEVQTVPSEIKTIFDIQPRWVENTNNTVKLVEKWKNYWDYRIELEPNSTGSTLSRTNSTKSAKNIISLQLDNRDINKNEISVKDHESKDEIHTISQHQPVKQELPEEVFKAFETSPKRFFGTSRQHILNKLDTFLGKPEVVNELPASISTICHESGLVSSRISLFHNMSNTEDLSWAKRKCQSVHDIYHKKETENITCSVDNKFETEQSKTTQHEVLKNYETKLEKTRDCALNPTSLKQKRIIHPTNNTSLDEIDYQNLHNENRQHHTMEEKELKTDYKPDNNKREILRKKSFSKSEMDIFNKILTEPTNDYLDKYKSCDELPKINVKNFISLYESVSKDNIKTKTIRRIHKIASIDSKKDVRSVSTTSDAVHKKNEEHISKSTRESTDTDPDTPIKRWLNKDTSYSDSNCTTPEVTPTKYSKSKNSRSTGNVSFETRLSDSVDIEIKSNDHKRTTYLSLSDIELEIVESSPDKSNESSPERIIEAPHIDYKSRFKSAKEYFQSLEELSENKDRKPRKLNECELLLRKESTESLENERPQRRVKRNIKSHSLPSSEISKIWNELKESQHNNSDTKLIKISEKFNVDDLFTDVMEGKLSRQGSLRGIPHKKAVLEAFRSMENVSDIKINSYEIAESQLSDFAKEYKVKNSQTYLSEYPYLPTTDPSKYHSRLDVKATGLISLKELLGRKPRRNSVPDLRLNTKFTEDL